MSNHIHTIKIKNFKAFDEEEYEFKLEGKHLLLYGENGSGKSSLFWALYTLLQSSAPQKDSKKYFLPGGDESLINIHTPASPASIKVVFENDPILHTLDSNGLLPNPGVNTTLRKANLASDFISHRLLLNFYNFKNSTEINLFPVFAKDILPFMQNARGDNLGDVYTFIETTPPFVLSRTGDIRNIPDFSRQYRSYKNRIGEINTAIDNIIANINATASNIYNDYFSDTKSKFSIELDYVRKLEYDYMTQVRTVGATKKPYTSKGFKALNLPFVRIKIAQLTSTVPVSIPKPQSFLNEAKLTGIALAIRFAVLDGRTTAVNEKFIALDDVLVSLDMSNREKVMELLLTKYAPDYQILMLTHDQGLFEFAKYAFEKKRIKNLVAYESYLDDDKLYECPFHRESRTLYAQAEFQFRKPIKDYSAAANYLRKDAESFLEKFLPIRLQYDINNGERDLNGKIAQAIVFAKENNLTMQMFLDLDGCRKFVFNPQSHYDIEATKFKSELEKAFKTLKVLHELKFETILKKGDKLEAEITPGPPIIKIYVTLNEDLKLLKEPTTPSFLSNAKIILKIEEGGIIKPNWHTKHSISDSYNIICKAKRVVLPLNTFQVFKLSNGNLLSTLRKY